MILKSTRNGKISGIRSAGILMALLITVPVLSQKNELKLLTAEFDQLLSEQFRPGEPGCAAIVARKGQIIYHKAFGMANLELDVPMKPDMVFRIGSITKQFTAVAILQLMEQGKLKLDDEITRFIPDYPTHGHKITIEHLLTHTSGIKSYTSLPEYLTFSRQDLKPEEIIDIFKNKPMDFAPGTRWSYCNSGYFLLGYIIEKVSGKTYREYIEENFFKPLNMTSTCYGDDSKIIKNRASGYQPSGDKTVNSDFVSMLIPYSAGAIQSTVGDLFKWNQALHSYKVISKESLEKAHTEYKFPGGEGAGYGYGWFISQLQGSRSIEHGGGINGFLTHSVYLPDEDVFVAVFSNTTGKSPEMVTLKMAASAIGKPWKPSEIQLDEKILDEFTGVYENEEGTQAVVSRTDKQLSLTRPGGSAREINPYEKDKFYIKDTFITIEFVRGSDGKVSKAVLNDRGNVSEWKRTDKKPVTRKEIQLSETILSQYVGEYQLGPGFTLVVTRDGNRLFAQATGQEKVEIFPESETKFFLKVVDAQLEFVRDASGNVSKAILYQGGQKFEAVRIK
ncbi:MAG: serine hydrolase [Bacteroidales bacterium]|nr:serine hydrolase [Bacteroidales bacterium]